MLLVLKLDRVVLALLPFTEQHVNGSWALSLVQQPMSGLATLLRDDETLDTIELDRI